MMLRPVADGDRDAVLALGVAEEAAWFGQAELSPAEVGEWLDDEGGLVRGVVALEGDGRVCGFASPGRRAAVFMAEPALTDALADALLPWLHDRCEVVELMAFAGDAARVAAFERHGLRHRRSSFLMSRSASAGPVPAATFPDGVDVAPYRFGEVDEAVYRLVYVEAAWSSVPGHAERDFEGWLEKERACRSVFLARRDGRPVGWVAGRLLDGGRGYISTLAVAVGERGRGLGRGLLLHALADLQRAGARGLTLGVEAENETALALYRSVGLAVQYEWRIYATASEAGGA